MLTNLLSNAIKFTPEDGGAITFKVRHREGMVAVALEDNGPGIAKEDLSKLFTKFFQAGSQDAGRPRGTGLGLVVCKELVELHKGRIEMTSELGRGTTTTVLLPVYSDVFALAEGFEELTEAAAAEKGLVVGCVAIQALALLHNVQDEATRHARLERLADEVAHHVHRGDVVLPIDPSWVALLGVTNVEGVAAISRRLRGSLPQAEQLRFGTAISTGHGKVETLLTTAIQSLDRDMTSVAREAQADP